MPKTDDTIELPEITVSDIDRCLQTGIFQKTFSGAACIASVGGRVFHRGVYGSLNQSPPLKKLDHQALFDLSSLTMPLGSGLAALKLASNNRLDLNASVNTTIPALRDKRFAKFTIDMLLDHTSGLPAMRSYWKEVLEHDEGQIASQKVCGTQKAIELVQEMLSKTILEYEPGARTIYSDIGFLILGWIIEGVVGKPLDVFLAREIFQPLGIADDLFFVRLDDPRQRQWLYRRPFVATEECEWREKMIIGEVHDPNAWCVGGVAGHCGLFGTADAVWKLVHAMWSSYRGESREFLGGTVRRFWTRSRRLRDTTRTLAWDTPSSLGSSCGKRFSKTSVGHTGYTGTSIWIDLSTDVIGVVLTNAIHPTREGKTEKMEELWPRIYELIAKHGEAQPRDPEHKTGAAAFSSGPGTTVPLNNPTRGPGKPSGW